MQTRQGFHLRHKEDHSQEEKEITTDSCIINVRPYPVTPACRESFRRRIPDKPE